MSIEDQINQTLNQISTQLEPILPHSYIIGGTALILHGIPIVSTSDIDILTTHDSAEALKNNLSKYRDTNYVTKNDDLFQSNFARYNLPLMDIEVMSNLKVCKHGIWMPVEVLDFVEISQGDLTIKIPTITELLRILTLFGREKDLKRIQLIINHRS